MSVRPKFCVQKASKPTIMPVVMDVPPSPAKGADMREDTLNKG